MAPSEKLKQSLYFSEEMLREIMSEAVRLDRSLSWTVQQAWRLARDDVRRFPSIHRGEPRPRPGRPPLPPAVQPFDSEARQPSTQARQPSAQVREFLKGKFDHEATG
jgi:uncharacterized small protein (TIGR04563 family)